MSALHTWTPFQDQPDQVLGHNDLVKTSNMRVYKLPVVVDLPRKILVISFGGLEHNLNRNGQQRVVL